jgi:GNAT superfamily N-acetyltransferase
LATLFAEDGMSLPARDELLAGTVAVNYAGETVGFIRVLEVHEGGPGDGAYVYPVIVFKSWQGHGVGRALIEYELARHGALKLVACRASRGFYPRAGFVPLDWGEVASVIAHDCELCPLLPTCDPLPFVRVGGA